MNTRELLEERVNAQILNDLHKELEGIFKARLKDWQEYTARVEAANKAMNDIAAAIEAKTIEAARKFLNNSDYYRERH